MVDDEVCNPSWRAAMHEYCVQLLQVLRESHPTDDSLPRTTGEMAYVDGDRIGYGPGQELDLTRLLATPEIESPTRIPALVAVETAMKADKEIARHLLTMVGTPGWSCAVTVPACLRQIRWRLIRAQDGLNFSETHFAMIYRAMEEYFFSDLVRFRAVAGLPGFQMPGESITLERGLRILRLDVRERAEALTDVIQYGYAHDREILDKGAPRPSMGTICVLADQTWRFWESSNRTLSTVPNWCVSMTHRSSRRVGGILPTRSASSVAPPTVRSLR